MDAELYNDEPGSKASGLVDRFSDADLYNRYVLKRKVKDPYEQELGPGRGIVGRFDDWLTKNVVEPAANAGWPNAGAGVAAGASAIADFVIPQTAGDFQPGAVFIKGPKNAYRAARKLSEKEEVLAKLRHPAEDWLWHETSANPKVIMQEGLRPQVGPIVRGTSLYDDASEHMGDPADLTFFRGGSAGNEGGGYSVWSTAKKLGKDRAEVTLDEWKKHGVVTASKPSDIAFGELYKSNNGWGAQLGNRNLRNVDTGEVVRDFNGKLPYQVEPGDIVTNGITHPSYILTGNDLIEFLKNSGNHWVQGALNRKK